jgi:hypothetical protein
MPSIGVGWQPSRSLSDGAEADRAFALAERLRSVNTAAAELGTAWPCRCARPFAHRQSSRASVPALLRQPPLRGGQATEWVPRGTSSEVVLEEPVDEQVPATNAMEQDAALSILKKRN